MFGCNLIFLPSCHWSHWWALGVNRQRSHCFYSPFISINILLILDCKPQTPPVQLSQKLYQRGKALVQIFFPVISTFVLVFSSGAKQEAAATLSTCSDKSDSRTSIKPDLRLKQGSSQTDSRPKEAGPWTNQPWSSPFSAWITATGCFTICDKIIKIFYSIWELTYYNLSVAYKMTQSNKICPSFQPGQEDKHPKTMNSPGAEGQKQYTEL